MQAKQSRSEYAANQEMLQSSNNPKLAQSQSFGYAQAFRKANKPTKTSLISRFFSKG